MTKQNEGPKNWRINGYLQCPACDEIVSYDTDPCVHCDKALHDRCFYSRAHVCVLKDLVNERPEYGTQALRDRLVKRLRRLKRGR